MLLPKGDVVLLLPKEGVVLLFPKDDVLLLPLPKDDVLLLPLSKDDVLPPKDGVLEAVEASLGKPNEDPVLADPEVDVLSPNRD